jgi:hypothetical protein
MRVKPWTFRRVREKEEVVQGMVIRPLVREEESWSRG